MYVTGGLCGLFRDDCGTGGSMDFAHAFARRLSVCVVLVFVVMFSFPASAGAGYASQTAAYQACQSSYTNTPYYYKPFSEICELTADANPTDPPGNLSYLNVDAAGNHYYFYWTGSAENACSSVAVVSGEFPGKLLNGYTFNTQTTDPVTGATVYCPMTFHAVSPPTQVPGCSSSSPGYCWRTNGSAGPSGSDLTSPQPANQWSTPANTVPFDVPPDNATTPTTPPPQMCGGGSCFNSASNQYCAVLGGAQECIAAPQSPGAQNCFTVGSGALCIGSPSPPLPPSSVIPNPQQQIQSSDTYNQADPNSGSNYQTGVTVYSTTPGSTSSGKGASDLGGSSSGSGSSNGSSPASSSSSGGSQDGVAGGSVCNLPPICTGDGVQCAVVYQTHDTRCNAAQIHTDLAGTQSAPTSGQHTFSEIDSGTVDIGQQVNNLDTSGFGYGTSCPFTDTSYSMGSSQSVVKLSAICQFGPWMAGLVLMLAGLKCADILGGRK